MLHTCTHSVYEIRNVIVSCNRLVSLLLLCRHRRRHRACHTRFPMFSFYLVFFFVHHYRTNIALYAYQRLEAIIVRYRSSSYTQDTGARAIAKLRERYRRSEPKIAPNSRTSTSNSTTTPTPISLPRIERSVSTTTESHRKLLCFFLFQ